MQGAGCRVSGVGCTPTAPTAFRGRPTALAALAALAAHPQTQPWPPGCVQAYGLACQVWLKGKGSWCQVKGVGCQVWGVGFRACGVCEVVPSSMAPMLLTPGCGFGRLLGVFRGWGLACQVWFMGKGAWCQGLGC